MNLELLNNKWILSLLLAFIQVGLLEYLKDLLNKNCSKKCLYFIKDHLLPFLPILMGVWSSFIIKTYTDNFIFNVIYYIVSIHLIYKIFFRMVIEKIITLIKSWNKK